MPLFPGNGFQVPVFLKTTLEDSDCLLVVDSAGTLFKITKSDLTALFINNKSPWNPTQIPVLLWLDANDSSSISTDLNGNSVSQWNDKSGNSRHLYQATDVLRPVVKSIYLNSKNALTFDGVNDYLVANSNFGYGNNINMFFVAKYNNNQIGLFDSAPSSQNVIRNAPVGAVEWWNGNPILQIDYPTNEFEIFNFEYKLSPNRVISKYINGGNFASISSSSQAAAAWTNLTIGSINTTDVYFAGSIAEIIFTSLISVENRQKIEGYLAWKWGLNLKLPVDHPYKSITPYI